MTRYRLIPANGNDLFWTQSTSDEYYVSNVLRNKGKINSFLTTRLPFYREARLQATKVFGKSITTRTTPGAELLVLFEENVRRVCV